jgi:hypothetical protein
MGQRTFHSLKNTIYQQVLKAGANEASAQQYQNMVYNNGGCQNNV